MNMQQVARGWFVYELTSSAVDLGWVTMSFMIPQVLFSLWGGVLADRVSKKSILVAAQSLNAIATLIMALIILIGNVDFWDFIMFGLFNGIVLALSFPARNAFVPDLVDERLIFTAMALNTTSINFARILAPAFSGFLIAWIAAGDTSSTFGVGIVYVVIGALYLLSAVTMLFVSKSGRAGSRETRKHPLIEILDGLKYVRTHPTVYALIILSIVPFMFGMPLNTLLPAFNEDILLGGPDDLGLLLSAMGIGAILGSLMLAASGDLKHKGTWLVVSCFGWGISTVLFGMAPNLWTAVGVLGLVGWLSSWNMSLNRGLLQVQVARHMRGRIMSIDMMSHGLMPLGVLPVSMIADAYDISTSLIASGAVFVALIGLIVLVSAPVRRLDSMMADVHRANQHREALSAAQRP